MSNGVKNIEIEARSFISDKEYKKLLKKLNKEAKFLDFVKEETVYFETPKGDLRLRRDQKQANIILKSGKIHDDSREEIEIKCAKRDFKKIKNLFLKLGFKEEIRWFRKRMVYRWKGVKLFLDDTKGYGKIIELETRYQSGARYRTSPVPKQSFWYGEIGKATNKRKIHKQLENKLKSLGITITSKKVFEEKFNYYKNNWRKIVCEKPKLGCLSQPRSMRKGTCE